MGGRHKLCRRCHGRVSRGGVADDVTMADLDALVAAQLPTMPANDEEPAPPADTDAWWGKPAAPKPGTWWEQWAGLDHATNGCEFHPDTEPAAIAAAQRAAVREALALEPGATPERLSELAVLPVWNVTRRLAEIGAEDE